MDDSEDYDDYEDDYIDDMDDSEDYDDMDEYDDSENQQTYYEAIELDYNATNLGGNYSIASKNYTQYYSKDIATSSYMPMPKVYSNNVATSSIASISNDVPSPTEDIVPEVYSTGVIINKTDNVKIVNSTSKSKSTKNTTTKNNKKSSDKKPVKIKLTTKKAKNNPIVKTTQKNGIIKSTQKNSIIKQYNPYLYELWLKLLNEGNITNITYSDFIKLLKENGININAKTFDVEKIIEICDKKLEDSKNKTI